MEPIRILSLGGALPSRVVTNDDLSKTLDTSDEWIYPRTGIHERHICGDGESALTLAESAAGKALQKAEKKYGIQRDEIGCVVTATMSGDYATPSISCLLQRDLSLPEEIPVLDVNAACSGFVYALETARGFLSGSGKRYGLVVGTEMLSRLVDWTDRTTCILFADGAGAAMIEKVPDGKLPCGSFLAARGGMEIHAGGAGYEKSYVGMDGKAVYRFAVEVLPKAADGALSRAGLTMDDCSWIVCHQANERIIRHFAKHSGQPPEKFFLNIDHTGNTSGASIPLALSEMEEKGLLHAGDVLLLLGFGSGLSYGGTVLTYGRKEEA